MITPTPTPSVIRGELHEHRWGQSGLTFPAASIVSGLGLAVDVAQNAAAKGYPNNPRDNPTASRE
jgi:hypothetical protein